MNRVISYIDGFNFYFGLRAKGWQKYYWLDLAAMTRSLIIVSGDSDLTTPVRQIRERFPNKRLIIVFPPTRRSGKLKKAAHGHFVIGADKLRQNLLPDEITTPSDYVLERPARWY